MTVELELNCNLRTSPRKGLPCGHYIRSPQGEPGFCTLPTRFRCQEALKHYLPSLSYSSLTDFIACKRRFYHRNILGIEPHAHQLPDAMKAGRLWDSWLQGIFENVVDQCQHSPEILARVQALTRAYQDLEMEIPGEGLLGLQYKVGYPIGENQIVGYADRAYCDHIVECKLSSRPEFYTHIETIRHQVGTYLLANEQWEYLDMEVVRLPDLRTGKGKYEGEPPEAYQERCYQDIISRPSHYFLGFDRETRMFGKRFWRSEFDLDELWKVYRWVFRELRDTIERGSWYPNTLSCHVPAPCIYHAICKTGVVSEALFRYRHKKGGETA